MAKTNRYWFVDNDNIGIVERATNSNTVDGFTSDYVSISEAKDIRYYAITKATDLTLQDMDDSYDEIPTQFHEVIVDRVIMAGYTDPRNLNIDLSMFFERKYKEGLLEAKKFSKTRYKRGGFIRPTDF